jgi:Rad3-related DNA helicase
MKFIAHRHRIAPILSVFKADLKRKENWAISVQIKHKLVIMAEIKSTLDLVLEKTRNLKMTEEEKTKQKQAELKGKLKGLIQQYLDGLVYLESACSNIRELAGDQASGNIVVSELLNRLDTEYDKLGSDCHPKIFDLIASLFSVQRSSLEKFFQQWETELESDRQLYISKIKSEWSQKQLFGSALMPNLSKTSLWKSYYKQKMDALKAEVLSILQL